MNAQKVTKVINVIKKKVSKRSPEILTGLGIAGMITTTILAVKATPKAMQLIEEESMGDPTTFVEKTKISWKCYIPTAITGSLSIACLIGAQSVNARRTAALATAYKLSEAALSEFKEAAVDVIGEDKVKEVKQKIAEKKVDNAISDESNTTVIISNDGDTWFIDPFSNTKFLSSKNKIDAAANRLNKDMRDEIFISLSRFYDEIGLEHTAASDDIGWHIDKGYIDVDLSDAIVRDGKAYIVMDFLVRPEHDFDRYY